MDEERGPGRRPLPVAGDETGTLLGALDRIRATFAWKTDGLTAEQLRTTLAPSTTTLGGLVEHLAFVEDLYLTLRLGAWMPAPWDGVDREATPDWPWSSAAQDSPDQLRELWRAAVQRSRAAVAGARSPGRSSAATPGSPCGAPTATRPRTSAGRWST